MHIRKLPKGMGKKVKTILMHLPPVKLLLFLTERPNVWRQENSSENLTPGINEKDFCCFGMSEHVDYGQRQTIKLKKETPNSSIAL